MTTGQGDQGQSGTGQGTQGQQGQEQGSNAGDTGASNTGGGDQGSSSSGITSLPEALSEVRSARGEAAAYRTQLRQAQQELQQAKDAQLSETDKLRNAVATLTQQNEQMQAQMRTQAVRQLVNSTAATMGFRNPALAASLVNEGDIAFDDKGNATNVDKLLKEVLKENPYLGTAGGGDGGEGQQGGHAKKGDMNRMIRQAAGHTE